MSEEHQQRAAAAAGPTTSDRRTATGPGMPRWVKAFIAVAALLAVLLLVGLLTGGHGPGRHLGSPTLAPTSSGHPPSGVLSTLR